MTIFAPRHRPPPNNGFLSVGDGIYFSFGNTVKHTLEMIPLFVIGSVVHPIIPSGYKKDMRWFVDVDGLVQQFLGNLSLC